MQEPGMPARGYTRIFGWQGLKGLVYLIIPLENYYYAIFSFDSYFEKVDFIKKILN